MFWKNFISNIFFLLFSMFLTLQIFFFKIEQVKLIVKCLQTIYPIIMNKYLQQDFANLLLLGKVPSKNQLSESCWKQSNVYLPGKYSKINHWISEILFHFIRWIYVLKKEKLTLMCIKTLQSLVFVSFLMLIIECYFSQIIWKPVLKLWITFSQFSSKKEKMH